MTYDLFGGCDLELEAEIWALSLEFGFWGRILNFEARIWIQKPYEGG